MPTSRSPAPRDVQRHADLHGERHLGGVGAQPAAAFRTAFDAARAAGPRRAASRLSATTSSRRPPQVACGQLPGTRSGRSPSITVVEFSDFQCPYCATVQTTLATVLPEYGTDVRVVFKNYPLSFHSHARTTAIAAECAHAQGRFWQFHDLVFGGRSALFDGI